MWKLTWKTSFSIKLENGLNILIISGNTDKGKLKIKSGRVCVLSRINQKLKTLKQLNLCFVSPLETLRLSLRFREQFTKFSIYFCKGLLKVDRVSAVITLVMHMSDFLMISLEVECGMMDVDILIAL